MTCVRFDFMIRTVVSVAVLIKDRQLHFYQINFGEAEVFSKAGYSIAA